MKKSTALSRLTKKARVKRDARLAACDAYREWLLGLSICDPACGSGAFLNAALDFLMAEHRALDVEKARIHGDALIFSDIENSILERNLYGVDLKQVGERVYVIEVNDNPNIDAGFEDEVLQEELYLRVVEVFLKRIERRKTGSRNV